MAFKSTSTVLVRPILPLDDQAVLDLARKIRLISKSPTTPSNDAELGWNIVNKYYSAQIRFLRSEDVGIDEPAVILLVSRESVPPPSLSAILTSCSVRNVEFEVALLVTISTSTSPNDIDEDAWEQLAIENGFEWVDVVDSQSASKLESSGESTGIARVAEALQSHMWEDMIPREGERPTVERSRDGDDSEGEETNLGAPPLPDPRPFIPTVLEFPSTFLPSLNRSAAPSAVPSTTAPPRGTFDDDFSPFVPPSKSSTTFPPHPAFSDIAPPPPRKTDAPPLPASLNFTSSNHFLLLDDDEEGDGGAGTGEDEEDAWFAKLAALREEAKNLDLEGKRNMAEKVLQGLYREKAAP